MKITNKQPVTLKEYLFNEEFLAESNSGYSLQSGFSFDCTMAGAVKTMFVTYEILCTVGGIEWKETIIPSDNPNQWNVNISGTETQEEGDVLISYKSSCKFNHENEGFDVDLISMMDFLKEYDHHTQTFLNQYGLAFLKLEEGKSNHTDLESNARCAIDNLRGNNMYEF